MNDKETIINKIRKFNRFYTNILGLLDKDFLESRFTLTEVRVLFEIYYNNNCTAKNIREKIDIDEGYLSRIIDRFVNHQLIKKNRSLEDGRIKFLVLTEKGKTEFLKLNSRSQNAISEMISNLSDEELNNLTKMMENIENILSNI